jgi:hypothetical protein
MQSRGRKGFTEKGGACCGLLHGNSVGGAPPFSPECTRTHAAVQIKARRRRCDAKRGEVQTLNFSPSEQLQLETRVPKAEQGYVLRK